MQSNDPRNIFFNHRQGDNGKNETQENTEQQPSKEQQLQKLRGLAEKYQKEGGNQLMKDIVSNVIEQKSKGQLTNEQLISFQNRIFPLLNSEQRNRLGELMEELLKL